ncbi:hypothetical protein ACFV4N_31300 [Actinosynnema sp. NPDC059797]
MPALRNLGWYSAAKVVQLMSGVYPAAATIGAVGRGVRELDAELLGGFATVLGVPGETLRALTGVRGAVGGGERSAAAADVAALLWDVRHLTAAQVREISGLADALGTF